MATCGDCEASEKSCSRLEHLLEACNHLQQAGMHDQASQLRKQCVAEMHNVLDRLKAAESELARLRNGSTEARPVSHEAAAPCPFAPDSARCTEGRPNDSIAIHTQLIEVNRTKLRQLGFAFEEIKEESQNNPGERDRTFLSMMGSDGAPEAGTTLVLDHDSVPQKLIEALCKEGVAKITSCPQLMTSSGRQACVQCGGEFPFPAAQGAGTVSIDFKQVGTELEMLPAVTGENKLRLGVRARCSQLDSQHGVEVNGQKVPGLCVRELSTAADLKAGQMMLISMPVEQQTEVEDVETEFSFGTLKQHIEKPVTIERFLIVRPEIVGSPECLTACRSASCTSATCTPCSKCEAVPKPESPVAPGALASPFDE